METINTIELKDASLYPDESVLRKVLGDSFPAYRELLKLYEANALVPEWRYYKDGKAWLCKVQQKGRTIVWMSAWRGYMQATVYLPSRLAEGVYGLDIGEERKNRIRETRNTGASKPCVFEIRDSEALEDFEKVMRYKMLSR